MNKLTWSDKDEEKMKVTVKAPSTPQPTKVRTHVRKYIHIHTYVCTHVRTYSVTGPARVYDVNVHVVGWGGVECSGVGWSVVGWSVVGWGGVGWGGVYLCYHWCRFGGHTGIAVGNIVSSYMLFSVCNCIILNIFYFVCSL